ncbi:MAG: NAD(P)H-binding protein [Herpetosiphonaceae bacterium]|nr:NAD(P)H-binding protein [Herpetosiphonaceae bacterium]
MNDDVRRVLVVGATGMLGAPVARRLKAEGFAVRILSRSPAKAAQMFGSGFEIQAGDVEDPASLGPALEGCAGVHINLSGGPSAADYERIEHQGTKNIIAAASQAQVEQITYLSAYTIQPKNLHPGASAAKWGAEQALRASGIPSVIFRATWFMESLPLFVQGNRALLLGKQPHPLHWLAAADYARMVARSYRIPAASTRALYIYGPQPMTMGQALAQYIRTLPSPIPITRMPIWLMDWLGRLTFNPAWRSVAELMAYHNLIGEEGVPDEANALLGAPTTTLEQWCAAQSPTPPASQTIAISEKV